MRKLALIALAACGRSPSQHVIALDTKPGLSDLSRGPDGVLWTEAERDDVVYRVALVGDGAEATAFPLDGIPDGLDVEAIDALPDGTFLLGTEGHGASDAAVWSARIDGGRMSATLARRLDHRAQIGDNSGIEGLCGDRTSVVVGIEEPITVDGKREAQLAVLDLNGDPAQDRYLKVALTSDTGKIAALDCAGPDDVIGIERHFGISRIVRLDLGSHTATVLRDVTDLAAGKNFEGLARLPDGRLALVNDNQYKGLDGPSQLTLIPEP